jgi:hypothetical protein
MQDQNPFADLIPANNNANANPFADLIPNNNSAENEPSTAQKALVGLGRSFVDAGEGVKQLALQGAEKVGFAPKGTADNYTQQADEERQFYENTPIGQSTTGKVARFVGNALPYVAVPGAAAEGLLARIAGNAAINAGIGAAQFVPENGSRTLNATAGGLLGAGGTAVGAGAAKVINGLKGNLANPAEQAIVNLGEQHNVPVFASDAHPTSLMNGAAQALEEVPFVGMRGPRQAQMQAAQQAAQNVTSGLENAMLATQYGGKGGLTRLQEVASSGDPRRAAAAQSLLGEIKNSGDDWQKIIENSGNLKLFRSKLIADQKYDKVGQLANQFGDVAPRNALKAVDDALSQANSGLLPDQGLVNKLQTIKQNLISKNFNYSQMRDARGEIGSLISDSYKGSNAAVGEKGIGLLQAIKNGIGADMDRFAQNNGQQLKTAWKNADNFYQNAVVPYKDPQLAKALTNASPDEIYSKFVTYGPREGGKGTSRAQRFYNALDEKGRAAVRYGMVSDALENAVNADKRTFSPASFATSLDRHAAAKGVFFKGQDKAEIDGFRNLMRHVDRAPAAVSKPDTGVKLAPLGVGLVAGGGAVAAPGATLAGIGGAYGLRLLMTTRTGRNFLLASSRLKPGSPALQKLYNNAANFIQHGITASTVNGINSPEGYQNAR